ncbi:MAG: DNA-packaging protein [Cypionkella sp.]
MASGPDVRRKWLGGLPRPERAALIAAMSDAQRRALRHHWRLLAHDGQVAPGGAWSVWLLMAGRGFGKTRAGAEWVRALAERDGAARIALVGASLAEVRAVMVEGASGLLSVARPGHRPRFEPSRRLLRWPSGAEAQLFSAAEPESLRGPQHSHAWCDELGKWDQSGGRADAAWDNLQLGLRLGARPRTLITTTPRAVHLLKRVLADRLVVVTRGSTAANERNLAPGFEAAMRRQFGDTMLGRQELDGEMLGEAEGALWSRALLERCREGVPEASRVRTVVAVDPPASAEGDACGIIVAALLDDGTAVVLADASVEKASPERWARAVAEAAWAWGADRVVAEANQGGAMVQSVLRAADQALPVKLVHARTGKTARAEPVATLYESGKVRHAGMFARLEDQLCGLMAAGRYQGPGRSPDRADALVWALTELMLGRKSEPRVRGL